jgi:hypothetical protein
MPLYKKFHKSFIKSIKAQKASYIYPVIKGKPIHNYLDFLNYDQLKYFPYK